MKAYQKISSLLLAIENCKKTDNHEWLKKHTDNLNMVVNGIFLGANFILEDSDSEKLVFIFNQQHFNDVGYYMETTVHKVVVVGSLFSGVLVRSISGKNKNDVKDSIVEMLVGCLNKEVVGE
jgi:hypothetical protein